LAKGANRPEMDAAIKKLVSGRLKARTAGPHPDPELLAAFAENSLPRHDREGLLNHLTTCADCRDTLYLAMPQADAQQVFSRPSSSSPSRLAIRWAALAASVVILGSVLVTNRWIFTERAPSVQPSAEAPLQKMADLKAAPVAGQAAQPQAPAIAAAEKVRPPVKHMTAKPQASMQFDQSGQVHLTSPQSATGANAAVAVRTDSLDKASSRIDWGLSASGDVQRSLDSGKNWQIVTVASGIPFRAISSIGNDVWVGGNAGSLYHSADSGQSWTKVEPVSTDDIIRINFSDLQNGLLSTANGQVWSTSDGGQSWRAK
jgi:Photosynthesis system II assembly factor YCF48